MSRRGKHARFLRDEAKRRAQFDQWTRDYHAEESIYYDSCLPRDCGPELEYPERGCELGGKDMAGYASDQATANKEDCHDN